MLILRQRCRREGPQNSEKNSQTGDAIDRFIHNDRVNENGDLVYREPAFTSSLLTGHFAPSLVEIVSLNDLLDGTSVGGKIYASDELFARKTAAICAWSPPIHIRRTGVVRRQR